MTKIDWNDTSQKSHRWTNGWRPSEIIAFDGQEAGECVKDIDITKVFKCKRSFQIEKYPFLF